MRLGLVSSSVLRLLVVSLLGYAGIAGAQPYFYAGPVAVTLSPSPVVFPETSPGQTSATVAVTVKNPGTSSVTLGTASINAAGSAYFAITANTCTGSLGAGATCTIMMDFAPPSSGSPANGTKTGTMTLPNGSTSTTVMLSGQAGAATFSPAPLTFAPTVFGQTSATQTTTLTNNSTAATKISSNAVASAGYTITASTCTSNAQLAVGGTCTVTVAFAPTAIGTQTGTVSVTDDIGTQTATLSGVGLLVNPAITTFPAEMIGNTESATVTFNFGGPGTVSSFVLVTQGALNLDFATGVQSSNYCRAALNPFAAGSTCTVSVNFKPIAPGLVTGAIYLYDNESTPQLIGMAYLNGIGNGPQAALYPGTQTTLFANTAGDAFGIAVDLNGNVFYDNSNTGNVTKQTLAGTTYTATTLGSGLGNFSNFGIDGAGNLFLPNADVAEEVYSPLAGTYQQVQLLPGNNFYALAIDQNNNLYLGLGNQLTIYTPNSSYSSGYSYTTPSTAFSEIIGLGIDMNKNVYLADAGNSALYELPNSGGSYPSTPTTVATGLGNNNSIAIDAAGAIYTTASNSYGSVLRYVPAVSNTYTALLGSFSRPNGVALDRFGNLYVTDDGSGNAVDKINVNSTESLTFSTTLVGATSAQHTATLVNTGNTNMTVTGLAFSNAVFSSTTTLSSCATLAPGASCAVPIAFTPTTLGAASGTLTFTDNTLGVAGTTQVVNLSGTGYENLIFTPTPPAALQTGQNAGTITVSVEELGGTVDTTQNPPITLTVTGPNSYSQTYGPTTPVNGVATFNTSANALTTVGSYSYSASTTTANFTASAPVSEVVSPYKLAINGITTPQAASSATTNSVTVSVVTNAGAATTQTNAITLTVTGPNSYLQSYGPFAASASTGAYTFTTAALTAAGTYTYAATSTASPDGVAVTAAPSVNQVITASAVTNYTVTAASGTAYVGYPDNITVNTYDQYGNPATNYAGTVMLTSTDPGPATLPAPFTLSSGTATQPVTFKTLTNSGWTVTATDTVNSALTGTSVAIMVQPIPVYTINSSTAATDTAAACTNQAAAGSAPGTTTDADCNIYAAFAAVTALNNANTSSYVPVINFVTGFATNQLSSTSGVLTMTSAISVTGNVSLVGPGTGANAITLSGGNAVTFLASSGNAVTNFTGLTFANFKGAVSTVLTGNGTMTFTNDVFTGNNYTSSSNNGGVMGINGNITVTGCTFTNNISAGGGGALASTPTAMVISNSLFSGNTAATYGGAYYSFGTGPVTITNTVFVGNKASSAYGGAVYINPAAAPLTVTNGTFNTNTSEFYGGAIYTSGQYTIVNSSFTGNSASGTSTVLGGAIYANNTGAANSISSTNFIGNFATTTSSTAYGGALYADHLNLTNVLFSGNYLKSSFTSNGGAVYLFGAYTNTWTGVTLTGNCTAPPSAATPPVPCAGTGATNQYGGAVYQVTANSTNNLYNVTITGNSAKVGGGWYKYNGSLKAYNSVISGNAVSASYPNVYLSVTSNNSSYIDTTTSTTCGSAFCTPVLSALGSYGGGTVGATVNGTAYTTPVQTIVPLPGSPLLAAGSVGNVGSPGTLSGGATIDARGYPRTINGNVDIGAVQSNYTLSFVTQPVNTAVNAALLPPPTVQLYESGVPFTAGAGQTLAVAAQSGSMFTTATDSTPYNSVAITASGLETLAPFFSTPQSDDALVVSVKNGAATPVTVATTTSEPFSITDPSAASIAFLTPPPAQLSTGANAGIVKVALTSAGGATNTSAAATTITIALAGTNYTATTVNGVATFNFATLNAGGPVVLTAGSYSYVASSSYTTDTVSAPETVGGEGVWVLNANQTLVKVSTAGVKVSTVTPSTSTAASFGGVAFDTAGDLYSVNAAANSLLFATSTGGSMATYFGGGLNAPTAIAVDGAGYIWIANSGNNTVSVFNDGRTAVSPATGYGTSDTLNAPSSIAIDITGGVWVANKTGNSVTHILGAATPVSTPLSSGTATGTLGAKP